MTSLSYLNNQYKPNPEIYDDIKDELSWTGINIDEEYTLKYAINTRLCRCGSLIKDTCETGLPDDFYDLLNDKGEIMCAFTKKHWRFLSNIYLKEEDKNNIFTNIKNQEKHNYVIKDKQIKININDNEEVILNLHL
jgi:hypothetical protein